MNNRKQYQSVFAPLIEEFIKIKEMKGVDVRSHRSVMAEIDSFFISNNIVEIRITRGLIEYWRANRVNDSDGTLSIKYSIWSQFSRFLNKYGYAAYIPMLPRYVRDMKYSNKAYIFTHEQIDLVLKESTKLKISKNARYHAATCIPIVLRLLYSTGVRISEALSLKYSDIKIDKGYIHMRKTKNKCERIVPISKSLELELRQYISFRDKLPVKCAKDPESRFFIKPDGSPCERNSIYKWLQVILNRCGFAGELVGQRPRIHDFRHTMAVHSLEQMVNAGMDIYTALPILSTCLGHKSILNTEYYVRLTYNIFPDIVEKCASITSYIFPKN